MVENFLGVTVPEQYHPIVTMAVLMLLFYGAEYVSKKATNAANAQILSDKVDNLLEQLAEATGKSEISLRRSLEKQFVKASKMRALGKAAVLFFRPSRNQNNDEIVVDNETIQTELVAAVPNQVDVDELDDETVQSLSGVLVEIHAKDKDKGNVGWAGVIPSLGDQRLKMKIFPTVKREDVWGKDEVWADVIVHFREDADTNRPFMFHLVNVHTERPIEAPHT